MLKAGPENVEIAASAALNAYHASCVVVVMALNVDPYISQDQCPWTSKMWKPDHAVSESGFRITQMHLE